MSEKEATVYIVDVGLSMGRKCHGRQQSDLDWAMLYVWDKITSTVATDRKTTTLGVLGLKTTGTANELSHEESFANISVFQEIQQTLLPDLQRLHRLIKLSKSNEGDAISALVIAIQMITKYCKKLKYRRRIVLVTNGWGPLDADDMSEITKKIKEDNMELVILGVDFDDPEYGFKEEGKDSQKARNEATFRSLTDNCDGAFGTLAQAIEELGIPRLKSTRPVHSYKGDLSLGNPQQFLDTVMRINVERYPRTMIRRPATASQFVQRTDLSNGHASTQSSATVLPYADTPDAETSRINANVLANVRSSRTYQVEDETAPGRKRDVDRDDLTKGYEYGRTAVHINESDEGVTKLETQAALEILGFVPWDKYDRYMNMSASNIIIGQKTNTKAILALSSVVHALFELESYAIARLVSKNGKSPVLLLLAPSIDLDYECLLDVQIPFAEDVRSYRFPPLDRVVTVSGKVLKEHRHLPNDELFSAMDHYVDSLDLSTFGHDDEGNPAEYMAITDTFSPLLHRIDQAIRWRAAHPTEPVPPPYEILTKYSKIPPSLVESSRARLARLVSAADVKKVPPKLRGRRRNHDRTVPVSGLDVNALLANSCPAPKISLDNPIPEFRQMLDAAEDPNVIHEAAVQLSAIIEKHVSQSFGDGMYGRVLEEMRVLREEMVDMEEPGEWNVWARDFKGRLLGGRLGDGREELWWKIRKEGLGLVTMKETSISDVNEEDAKLTAKIYSVLASDGTATRDRERLPATMDVFRHGVKISVRVICGVMNATKPEECHGLVMERIAATHVRQLMPTE